MDARSLQIGGIRDFHLAKRKAAHRLGIHDDASLPRNSEIQEALRDYQRLFQGASHDRLLAKRREAAAHALAFFVLRWWRMTSRRRSQRFSFAPILGAGFWGVVLLLLIRPQHQPGPVMAALVLVMTATIVQLVSPWEEPPAQPARRVRLRYA